MISPYDRDLINEGSELRRKFIDGVIAQFSPPYLDALLQYNKALGQRNALLKQFGEQGNFDRDLLILWEQQMLKPAQVIFETRKAFIADFQMIFQKYYAIVSGGNEQVKIVYESGMHKQGLEELFAKSLSRDRATRYTNVGIHKDDLVFLMNDFPVKRFGSQGQQKSFVIAIRLAQYELLTIKWVINLFCCSMIYLISWTISVLISWLSCSEMIISDRFLLQILSVNASITCLKEQQLIMKFLALKVA